MLHGAIFLATCNAISVTRYFASQLLNKHAKNYQNVEKITKFLLSTKVVWKSIKHLSKIKISKMFCITETVFFPMFFFLIVLFDWICVKCKYGAAMIGPRVPRPTGWVLISRIPSIQLDSLSQQLAIWMYSFAGVDLQLFSLNFWITGCVMAYLVEFHTITKILLTFREITKKITKNFQLPKKSEKSRNITKSN
jgi:hypothetical protein